MTAVKSNFLLREDAASLLHFDIPHFDIPLYKEPVSRIWSISNTYETMCHLLHALSTATLAAPVMVVTTCFLFRHGRFVTGRLPHFGVAEAVFSASGWASWTVVCRKDFPDMSMQWW
jgi:hypothetical protein